MPVNSLAGLTCQDDIFLRKKEFASKEKAGCELGKPVLSLPVGSLTSSPTQRDLKPGREN
jgi:hypothetical protein